MTRAACLFMLVLSACVPALADTYALVTFNTPSLGTNPYLYATPFATFGGGTVEGSPASGYSYEATSAGQQEIGFNIDIAPSFPVHEIRFDIDYDSPSVSSASLLVDARGPGLSADSVAYPGQSTIDLVDPDGITTLYIYDRGYTPESSATLDNVAFNPSVAPVASTPEPTSWVLCLTGLSYTFGVRRWRTVRLR